MAQGCNLHIDRKDLKDIKATFSCQASKNTRSSARGAAREMLQSALNRPEALIQILNDLKNPNYEKAKLALEAAMIGERVPAHEKHKLVPALNTILRHHNSLPGMFEAIPKSRGPGSGPMAQHFELTATAKLCQLGEQKQVRSSSTGVNISIHPSDKVSFGYKYAANYAYKSKGGTIEGDITIHRGNTSHGMDTKYTKGNVKRLNNEKGFSDKLKHVSSALLDGQLQSYTYVTNAEFSKETKEMIFEVNCKLIENHARGNNKLGAEVNKRLNTQQDKSYRNYVSANELMKNNETYKIIEALGKDYPLIGTAEKINFKP